MVILDSSWSAERAVAKPKQAVVRRTSTDGREFDVYKRYFDTSDIVQMAQRHGFQASVAHAGRAFIAATATLVD